MITACVHVLRGEARACLGWLDRMPSGPFKGALVGLPLGVALWALIGALVWGML